MDRRLRGKRALISGGFRGIGRTTAMVLAGEGCDLLLMARTTETLSQTGADIRVRFTGPVATGCLADRLRQRAATALGDAERRRELCGSMPFRRPAMPEEITCAAAFLVSLLSAYTWGAVLTIDGDAPPG